MHRYLTKKNLMCRLSEEELRERSDTLAINLGLLEEAKALAKLESQRHKAKQSAIQAQILALATQVKNREEERPVECQVQRNLLDMTVETVRTDTGEVIETRAMTDAEKQMSFADAEQAAAATRRENDDAPQAQEKKRGRSRGARLLPPPSIRQGTEDLDDEGGEG